MNEIPMSKSEPRRPVLAVVINFDLIDQNPYRDLINNPLLVEQVERLALSIQSTDFWDNVMVRPHPTVPGRYQLAYGHARLAAAREAGLHEATFFVRPFSDDEMIRIMADENVTQFGKNSFKTYKEATVAAATYLMVHMLKKPEPNFRLWLEGSHSLFARREELGKCIGRVRVGGCPGEDIIDKFYRNTLDKNQIELALEAFHTTGELREWHRQHNPRMAQAPESEPTVNPEAIRHFDKPSHVRSFIQAVQETKTPYDEQKRVADRIIADFGPEPKPAKSGRTKFQAERKREDRFNAGNIRNRVVVEALNRTRSPRRKAEIQRHEQMTTLERALGDLNIGLSRSVSGIKHLLGIIRVMGNITDYDITPAASEHLRKAANSIADLERCLKDKTFHEFLRVAQQRK